MVAASSSPPEFYPLEYLQRQPSPGPLCPGPGDRGDRGGNHRRGPAHSQQCWPNLANPIGGWISDWGSDVDCRVEGDVCGRFFSFDDQMRNGN